MNRNDWAKSVSVGGQVYGGSGSVYIIAEIGSNHGGSLERAKELVTACSNAGVNAVKFQSWTACGLQNVKDVLQDGTLTDSTVLPILEKYEVPKQWHDELYRYCDSLGVDFLSTPFDLGRARLLNELGVPAIKIASGDLSYDELLKEVAGYGIPLLLSTGMASMEEIEHALECFGQGFDQNVVLLYCVAAYPPEVQDANILAVRTLADRFGLPVGISDHYPGHETVLAAVALGAVVIEKHVTFSRQGDTPDSPFALEIEELDDMVKAVRSLEVALGSGVKQCTPSEEGGLIGGRRSLFAARNIESGELMTRDDISVVRPNIAELKPGDLSKVIGCRVNQPIQQGEPLQWEMFQ